MSEKEKTGETGAGASATGKDKEERIRVEIDRSKEVESLQDELKRISEQAKADRDKVEALAKEKEAFLKEKADWETEKSNLTTEKEELKGTLGIIAEKEYNAKKTAILGRAKGVFGTDDTRYKEIEGKLSDPEKGPENLKQTEYMMDVLEESMRKGREEAEKAKKLEEEKRKAEQAVTPPLPPTGGETAKLTQEQITGGATAKPEEETYESYKAMIDDLRTRARDPSNPARQAEAEAILKELFIKWGKQVRKDFEEKTGMSKISVDQPKEEQNIPIRQYQKLPIK